jgi:hypothetical protein
MYKYLISSVFTCIIIVTVLLVRTKDAVYIGVLLLLTLPVILTFVEVYFTSHKQGTDLDPWDQ